MVAQMIKKFRTLAKIFDFSNILEKFACYFIINKFSSRNDGSLGGVKLFHFCESSSTYVRTTHLLSSFTIREKWLRSNWAKNSISRIWIPPNSLLLKTCLLYWQNVDQLFCLWFSHLRLFFSFDFRIKVFRFSPVKKYFCCISWYVFFKQIHHFRESWSINCGTTIFQ